MRLKEGGYSVKGNVVRVNGLKVRVKLDVWRGMEGKVERLSIKGEGVGE